MDILGYLRERSGSTPNKFTIDMGKLVRKARREANMSQSELADLTYMRQASISDIENGKREVSTSELVYMSYALDKPIVYFFPPPYNRNLDPDTLSPIMQELVIQAQKLSKEDLKKILVQIKALGDLSE